MNLYSYFHTQQGPSMIKNMHYFPVYERHFARYINRPVLMFEIGTGNGGSSKMWKQYFGPMARIVTMDIEDCAHIAEPQIYPRRGDQSDLDFLSAVLEEFGEPDIILDDGSHQMPHVNATFDFLFPFLRRDGVYLVEDLNTAYWESMGGGLRSPGSFIERAKGWIDEMNANTSGALAPTEIGNSIFSINFYDLMVAIEKTPYVNRELLRMPASK